MTLTNSILEKGTSISSQIANRPNEDLQPLVITEKLLLYPQIFQVFDDTTLLCSICPYNYYLENFYNDFNVDYTDSNIEFLENDECIFFNRDYVDGEWYPLQNKVTSNTIFFKDYRPIKSVICSWIETDTNDINTNELEFRLDIGNNQFINVRNGIEYAFIDEQGTPLDSKLDFVLRGTHAGYVQGAKLQAKLQAKLSSMSFQHKLRYQAYCNSNKKIKLKQVSISVLYLEL